MFADTMKLKLLATVVLFAAPEAHATQSSRLRRKLQTDITTPEAAMKAAAAEVASISLADKRLAYKFVRLGFHDCIGGCDGCVDLLNVDNKGLDIPIALLDPIVAKYAIQNVTRADIWALAALQAAEVGQDVMKFPFEYYGRPTCEMKNPVCLNATNGVVTCSSTRGPHRVMPSSNFDTRGIVDYFSKTFQMTPRETVAIMGAHTFAVYTRTNSGFDSPGGAGGWVKDPGLLNNDYYAVLVGGNETFNGTIAIMKKTTPTWVKTMVDNQDLSDLPCRHQWQQKKNKIVMINADIALVRNFEGQISPTGEVACNFLGSKLTPACPVAFDTIRYVAMYKNNNTLWLEDFRDVFTYVLEYPYITPPCETGVCYIGELATN